ncbi:protein-tyrosine phosphatase family protein [Nonomuraea typhae]|uniref:Protein-tyrosine phosphatase family protein n=1 Tax=Nonomuraea typhae TaxID=2603600 RepID=A0ABW7YNI0_9ACTN
MSVERLTGAVQLPEGGGWVRGRGYRKPLPGGPQPSYGLYLGSARVRRKLEHAWAHDWIEWPDFLLPRDTPGAVRLIRALHGRVAAGELAEVACGGGVGRTGTVLSCLAVISGLSPDDAIAWTRASYHPRAVETPWQRRWIARFPST